MVQSAGAVEYTDCISAEGQDPLKSVLDMVQSIGAVECTDCITAKW